MLLSLGALLVDARKVSDYFDRSDSTLDDLGSYLKSVAKALDKHGSENAETTAKLLGDMQQSLEDTEASGEDKFNLLTGSKLGKLCGLGKICGANSSGMDKFLSIIKTLKSITGELSVANCNKSTFDVYLDTVESVFGADLDAFASNQRARYTKLHAFLLHYGKKLAQFCMENRNPDQQGFERIEALMDRLLTGPDTFRLPHEKLLVKAKELDLVKGKYITIELALHFSVSKSQVCNNSVQFVGELIQEHSDVFKARKKLHEKISVACGIIRREFSEMLNFFNLGRLLMPDEIDKMSPPVRLQKVNEYLRICLPTFDDKNYNSIHRHLH